MLLSSTNATATNRDVRQPNLRGSSISWSAVAVRTLFVTLALGAWFFTQSLIGGRTPEGDGIVDLVHVWTAPAHDYLQGHPGQADLLLVVSSAAIDALGAFLLLRAIFGPSLRPLLGLLILFGLRQACQGLCALPAPEGMIWRSPGVPSLLVTYGVTTDLFFSGHTALAVLGAIELAWTGRPWLRRLGVALALFEASTVLVLRAHWTMDVFAGAVAAMVAAGLAQRWAPTVDGCYLVGSLWRDRCRPMAEPEQMFAPWPNAQAPGVVPVWKVRRKKIPGSRRSRPGISICRSAATWFFLRVLRRLL